MLTMLLLDLVKQAGQVVVLRYIALVGAELAVTSVRLQLIDQLVQGGFVRAVRESE